MIRGEPAIGHEQSPANHACIRLNHVGPDHEALVEVAVDLLVDRCHDGRRSMAEVLAGDPAGEVEELATLDVPDPGSLGTGDDE